MFTSTDLGLLHTRHPIEMDVLHARLGRANIDDAGYRFHMGQPYTPVVLPQQWQDWPDAHKEFAQWAQQVSSVQLAGHARGRVAVVQLNLTQLLATAPEMWPLELVEHPRSRSRFGLK